MFHEKMFPSILAEHGIILSSKQQEQFQQYAKMLQEWNEKMNLTAITKTEEIYEKHFLDCILPSFEIQLQGSLCDVGAGAGFPSIPLKIVYPDLQITIVEPIGKRCRFLNALCDALALNDVSIVQARAEEFANEHREAFDIVTARAVANLNMLSELCIPLVKKNGIFLAMKGANGLEEAKQAKQAVSTLGCELEQQHLQQLLDGSSRYNLIYRKTKHTPKQYPRAFAIIKKKPL